MSQYSLVAFSCSRSVRFLTEKIPLNFTYKRLHMCSVTTFENRLSAYPTFTLDDRLYICCGKNIRTLCTPYVPSVLHFSRRNFRWFFNKDEAALAVTDGVDTKQFSLVYQSTVVGFIYFVQVAVLCTFAVTLVFAIYTWANQDSIDLKNNEFVSTPAQVATCGAALTFFTVAMVTIIRRLPIRMYYSEDKKNFILVFLGLRPWKMVLKSCAEGEVKKIGDKRWHLMTGSYSLHGRRLILYPYSFRLPAYYNKLMGHTDQPVKPQRYF